MIRSSRITLAISGVLLFGTLCFQQCAPTEFGTIPSSASAKAEGDDVVKEGDGDGGEVVDDPVLGEVPVEECPVAKKENSCDKNDDVAYDEQRDKAKSEMLLVKHHGSQDKKQKDKCAVLCHRSADHAKTIYVGMSAVEAHVKNHGDTLGRCADDMGRKELEQDDEDDDHQHQAKK